MKQFLVAILCGFVKLYSYAFSSITPAHCRYTPTCSQYAVDALKSHGPLTGCWLTLKRIIRCHPWGASGYDPVPESLGSDCQDPRHHHLHKTNLS